MLDNPCFHGLKDDPRKNVRDMYKSKQTQFCSLAELGKAIGSNQASVFDGTLHDRQMTLEILDGKTPSRQKLKDGTVILMTWGHHLRINDVLSESVNTYLARMMDSGIVRKLYNKYYMTDGKQNSIRLQ